MANKKTGKKGKQQKKSAPKEPAPKAKQHIGGLLPLNLVEQQALFFENQCQVNPVFQYTPLVNIPEYTARFPANDEYLGTAIHILDSCIADFGSESSFMSARGTSQPLTEAEITATFTDYVQEMGVEGQVNLVFSEQALAPAAVLHDPATLTSKLTLGLPIVHRAHRFRGVLHHELGTHLVRTYNERHQVWHKKRKKYSLAPYIETEEGFASVNTVVECCFSAISKPYLWRGALHYYSSYQASRMSFVELFHHLAKYVNDPYVRFKQVVRGKRGLEDTSQPGGCYKDQVYLPGAIKVLEARHSIDFFTLIAGKLSLEDHFRPDIQSLVNKENILVPLYMRDFSRYMHALDVIAEVNGIQ